MDKLWQDLRYGARMLARKPGFTAVIVIALALGIGPNTAIFSIINTVLLTPLPYEDPATLVTTQAPRGPSTAQRNMLVSTEDFQDWRSITRAFERMALYAPETATLTGGEEPVRLNGSRVSPALFPLLRVQPAAGRIFSEDEEKPGAAPSVILSYVAWERRFGTDRSIVGRPIRLDGNDVTVIGIMPTGFAFPNRETEYWVPFTLAPPERSVNERRVMVVPFIARLKTGVSIAEAEAEGTVLIQRLRRRGPDPDREPEAGKLNLVTLQDRSAGPLKPALLILLAAVAFVLLIACANVANLLLARAADRAREVSIRAALGAGRLRLLRQMLTESILLSAVGGAAGLLLAHLAISALPRLVPADIPALADVRMNPRILVFAAAVSMVSGLLFGSAPALLMGLAGLAGTCIPASRAMSVDPIDALRYE
jgi:predicted permease